MTTILVTGATGTIGSRLTRALSQKAGVTVRVAVRDAAKAKGLEGPNVTPVDFDWDKPETIAAAVKGVDRVFLLTPMADNQVELAGRLVDAAKAAGVKHIVKLSAQGADMEPGIQLGRWHRGTEKLIEASGIAWTFLRPGSFMDNFVNYYGPDKEGAIYIPIGDAGSAFIDARDIADVAALVLTSDGHAGKAYALTGPEAVTIAQAAEHIAGVTGRSIKYVDVPPEAAKGAMLGMGMPGWAVDAMGELYAIMKAGYTASTVKTVEELTGKPARTFAEFARDNAAAWKK